MFKTEREMQDLFIKALARKYDHFFHLFEEVNTNWCRPDVVMYRNLNNIWVYELKLTNSKKVWYQALKNLHISHKSYIVVPVGKGLKIPAGWNGQDLKGSPIGILEFDGENIIQVKKCKKNPYNIKKEILLHSLATQQYKGGMRMFNSYK